MKFATVFATISAFAVSMTIASPMNSGVMKRADEDHTVYEKLAIRLVDGKTMEAHNMSPAEAASLVARCCVIRDQCCGGCC